MMLLCALCSMRTGMPQSLSHSPVLGFGYSANAPLFICYVGAWVHLKSTQHLRCAKRYFQNLGTPRPCNAPRSGAVPLHLRTPDHTLCAIHRLYPLMAR
jgi:hypothetical protein